MTRNLQKANNISSLIASTTNPVNGMEFETLGYSTIGDGGGNI